LKQFKELKLANTLANIIAASGGNSVWSTVLVSIYAAILMTRFKPDIIATNPPWIHVLEFKSPYVEQVRQYMLNKIRSVVESGRVAQVLKRGRHCCGCAREIYRACKRGCSIHNE
jgi:hypothetical protein